jgi:ribosomal protein S21
MGISIQEGESQVPPLYRFQKMMQMNGKLREAKSHRHFLCKELRDYTKGGILV